MQLLCKLKCNRSNKCKVKKGLNNSTINRTKHVLRDNSITNRDEQKIHLEQCPWKDQTQTKDLKRRTQECLEPEALTEHSNKEEYEEQESPSDDPPLQDVKRKHLNHLIYFLYYFYYYYHYCVLLSLSVFQTCTFNPN